MSTHLEIRNTLVRHFDKINSIARFKSAVKVFIPENNLGNEATHMHSMIRDRPDVRTYWEKEDRPGIRKSHRNTDDYHFLMDEYLGSNSIGFDTNTFTCSRKQSVNSVKNLAREQMEAYHIEYDKERNKKKLTGKSNDKQDDLNIALMMLLYWARVIQRDPRRLR